MHYLSIGAKIGIGVAVPVFALGVIAGLCLFFLLRRHKKVRTLQGKAPSNQAWVSPSRGQEGYTRQDHQHHPPMSELQGPRNGANDVPELGSKDPNELGSPDPYELSSLQATRLAPQQSSVPELGSPDPYELSSLQATRPVSQQSSITYANEIQGRPLNSNSLRQPNQGGQDR